MTLTVVINNNFHHHHVKNVLSWIPLWGPWLLKTISSSFIFPVYFFFKHSSYCCKSLQQNFFFFFITVAPLLFKSEHLSGHGCSVACWHVIWNHQCRFQPCIMRLDVRFDLNFPHIPVEDEAAWNCWAMKWGCNICCGEIQLWHGNLDVPSDILLLDLSL